MAVPMVMPNRSHVDVGGVNLGEDAVLSQGLGAEPCSSPAELLADRDEPWRADPADEEVGVDAGRPGPVAVVEPGAEAYTYRASQGDVPAVEVEASVDDVGELQPGELLGREGVEGDQGDRERYGGVGRVQGLADSRGVEGQGRGGIHGRDGHAPGGVGEDQLAGLEHFEKRPQSVLGPVASGPGWRPRRSHLCGGDLGQGLVAGVGPGLDDRGDPHDVDAGGLGVAGALSGCSAAPVEHDLEPDLQLRFHRFGQVGGLGGEGALDVRDPVVDEHVGGGEDIEGGGDVAVVAGQFGHFGGADLRPRGVLEDLQEPQGSDDFVGLPSGPSVACCVVAYHRGLWGGLCKRVHHLIREI